MRMENHKLGDRYEEGLTDLTELCDRVLSQRRLILVSNRGPVEHHTTDGRVEARRGSGSVVTSFSSLSQTREFTWVSSAMGEGDRAISSGGDAVPSPLPDQRISLRYVTTPRRAYHKYYNVICNPLLWFLQHYMWNPPHNPTVDNTVHDAWDTGYVAVNEAFARAVVAEARSHPSPPVVLGHDYHLYLLPEFVRRDLPGAIIQHYIHVPWPTPLVLEPDTKAHRSPDLRVSLHGGHRRFSDPNGPELLPGHRRGVRARVPCRPAIVRRGTGRADLRCPGISRIHRRRRGATHRRRPSHPRIRGAVETGEHGSHHRANRPHRAQQEHREGLSRLRSTAVRSSRDEGPHQVPGIPRAVPNAPAPIPALHGRSPAVHSAGEQEPRFPWLAAHRCLHGKQLRPGHRRDEALRTRCW